MLNLEQALPRSVHLTDPQTIYNKMKFTAQNPFKTNSLMNCIPNNNKNDKEKNSNSLKISCNVSIVYFRLVSFSSKQLALF